MNPKDGKAGKAVAPAEPDQAEEADIADPGKMDEIKAEQVEKEEGKYGATQVTPHKPPEEGEEEAEKKTWIEIKLLDEEGVPVAGEKYRVELADGTTAEGSLDQEGLARIEGVDPGNCVVTYPDLDEKAWE
ncbi:MAG: hypothetical protein KAJ46_03600 [Sedimentisphaerales bacterium]|nr:hypothetical protein [Sedimentisphaerales bacterium]